MHPPGEKIEKGALRDVRIERVKGVDWEKKEAEKRHGKIRETEPPRIKPITSETVRISSSKLDSTLLKAEELVSLKLISSQQLHNLREAMNSFEHWKMRWTKVEPGFRALRGHILQTQDQSHTEGRNSSPLANVLDFLSWNHGYIEFLGREIRTLTKAAEQDQRTVGIMVDDLLDHMKHMAMLPFSTLFVFLPRMVREISRDQGKEVDIVLEGGEIEIDRRILEEIKDPFIHLLRNAIDHGVEDPGKRVEREKPRRGTIKLTISRVEGSKVEILLSDDGNGIDIEQVKKESVKRGLISRKKTEHLKDHEVLSLIFRSGTSSATVVSEISGRGLGLAIVQERVETLGGFLSVESKPGVGTSFRIQLPVTLATFRGILVQASGALFIVPSSHVERVTRIHQDEVKTVENRDTISLNDRALSLVSLADVLELPRKRNQKAETGLVTVIVLGGGEKRIAFKVDKILSEQEVLVKSLGKQLSRVPNIAGATVLGTGEVVPVLNVHDLLKSPLEVAISGPKVPFSITDGEARRRSILVVEDSIITRMLLKRILESAGYVVKTAVDGLDAYTALKAGGFDLVVSDVDMPRMTGFELTEKIRSDTELADTPVVLVTGMESIEDRERGVDVRANAYIVKSSFDQNNLLDVIGRFI